MFLFASAMVFYIEIPKDYKITTMTNRWIKQGLRVNIHKSIAH